METVILDDDVVRDTTPFDILIPALDDAFTAYARGDAVMPPKSYIDLPQHNGDFRSMPAYVDTGDWTGAGLKWVNVHPTNETVPTVMAIAIYNDPDTGAPRAILDGTELTGRRTGAVAGLATDYLAVDDATTLGIIGAGAQAYLQVEAIASVRPISDIVVVDQSADAVDRFRDYFEEEFTVREGTIDDAGHCDVLSTMTPVESPIVSRDALGSHTHVNAMGADAAGKQELDPQILCDSCVVIDDWEQAIHSGEVNVPHADGTITDSDIYGTLGEVVAGMQTGQGLTEIPTVFDSTGLAIQDVTAAHIAYTAVIEGDHDVPSVSFV